MAATVLGVTSRLNPPREKGRERLFSVVPWGVELIHSHSAVDFSLWLAACDRVTCPFLKLSLIDTG